MEILTERRIQILKVIIEEYIETAEPIGSELIDKKYNLGVSPATIRNEMVALTNLGFLKKPHISAGRAPTSKALKYYVDHLMKMRHLSVIEEVNVKQKIWDFRTQVDRLLRQATKALAHETKSMSLAATNDGEIYVSGIANLFDMPEFINMSLTKHLLEVVDEYDYWWHVVSSIMDREDHLAVLFGDELDSKKLNECAAVFISFESPVKSGAIGIIGPARLNYSKIIPTVRFIGDIITQSSRSW